MKKLLLGLLAGIITLLLTACPSPPPPAPAGDFSLSVNPITITKGSSGTTTVTINRTNGFADQVALTLGGLAGVTGSFNPASADASSVLTIAVANTVASGSYLLPVTGTADGKTHTAVFSLNVTAVADTTKPQIVSTTPANGDKGILANAKIVIKFSEPMDQVATQNAFQSANIGAHTYSWSDAGKTLTVTPNSALQYSPNNNYKYYNFSITTAAKDLAGNNLVAQKNLKFSTLRTFFVYFKADKNVDGFVWNTGKTWNSLVYLRVGDWTDNHYARAFLSFNIGAWLYTNKAVAIKKAEVQAYQYKRIGHPYQDLKGSFFAKYKYLNIYHMNYGSSLDKFDFNRAPLSNTPKTFSSSYSVGYKTVEVTAWVADDYHNRRSRGNRSQFRLQFYKNTDNDSHDDYVEFYSSNNPSKQPILRVWYLRP